MNLYSRQQSNFCTWTIIIHLGSSSVKWILWILRLWGVPRILETAKLKQDETFFRRKENMLILKFKDKREVHMLSTIHPANMAVTNKVDRNTGRHFCDFILPKEGAKP